MGMYEQMSASFDRAMADEFTSTLIHTLASELTIARIRDIKTEEEQEEIMGSNAGFKTEMVRTLASISSAMESIYKFLEHKNVNASEVSLDDKSILVGVKLRGNVELLNKAFDSLILNAKEAGILTN